MAKETAQFQVLTEQSTVDRLDALRIVLGVTRANVVNGALEGPGLGGLEMRNLGRLVRLQEVARRQDKPWELLVREYAAQWARKSGPTLEDLERGVGIEPPAVPLAGGVTTA